jgi:hypothetical protein
MGVINMETTQDSRLVSIVQKYSRRAGIAIASLALATTLYGCKPAQFVGGTNLREAHRVPVPTIVDYENSPKAGRDFDEDIRHANKTMYDLGNSPLPDAIERGKKPSILYEIGVEF